jgi:hypothetical protein
MPYVASWREVGKFYLFNTHFKLYCKNKAYPKTDQEGSEGEQRYSSTLYLTSGLDGVDGRHNAPTILTPGKTRTQCTGGWVGPKVGLEGCGKISPQLEFDPRAVQSVAGRYTD